MDQHDNLGGLSPNSPSVALCVASFADDDDELRKNVPEDQILDITVTCDGWYLGQARIPVSLWHCSGGVMEVWKSAGCGSTEQALPGLCHTP